MTGAARLVLLALLLPACAQVREITGGAEDRTGPVLNEAVPGNYSTRFVAEHILLRFNERIQLESGRDKLLVSPPLDAPPTLRVLRGTDLEMGLNAPLRPNTTYTFALDGLVKDLTEGNYAAGTDYVVSTGDALDSLAIAGLVVGAFDGAREKGVVVMVHDARDTLDFTNSRPLYATRTDSAGAFMLRHLPTGAYTVTALKDQNSNYRYDLPNEEIAFAAEPLQAMRDSAIVPLTLRLFQERSAKQALREAFVTEDAGWRFVLARPAERLALRDLARVGGSLHWDAEWNTTRDSVLLWPSDTTALGLGEYEVSTEDGALDTLRYRRTRKMPFNTALTTATGEDENGAWLRIEAARPIASVDAERIRLGPDSALLPFTAERDSLRPRVLMLRAAMAPGAQATALFQPKAVRDIYNGGNDTLRIALGRAAEQRTGTLRITMAGADSLQGELVIQLLDGQRRVVREALVERGRPLVWEHIAPGNHSMRLIADANGNGRWDTGAWRSRLQAERVWYYTEPLNVRAAWDLGVTWELPRQ